MIRFGVKQKRVTWRNVYTQEGKYPLVKWENNGILCLPSPSPSQSFHFVDLSEANGWETISHGCD